MGKLDSKRWRWLFQAELRVTAVFLGFAAIGWLLNGFNASPFVCSGTVTMCIYLGWVGLDGIALVSVWVVGLMSMATISSLWLHGLPRPEYKFIPMLLLASWLLALAVAWFFGRTSDVFRRAKYSWFRIYPTLIIVAAAGLRFGWLLYPKSLSNIISLML